MKNTTKPKREKPLAESAKMPIVSEVAARGLDGLLREAERTRLKADIGRLENKRNKVNWRGSSDNWRDFLDQCTVIDAKEFALRELTRDEENTQRSTVGERSLSSEIERLQGLESWSAEDRSNATLLMAIGVRRLKRDYSYGSYSMH